MLFLFALCGILLTLHELLYILLYGGEVEIERMVYVLYMDTNKILRLIDTLSFRAHASLDAELLTLAFDVFDIDEYIAVSN
jgi:hypothetical protein